MTTLVLAPIPLEVAALAEAFDERWGAVEPRAVGRRAVRRYRTPAVDLALAEGGFGKVDFALTAGHLLDHLPDVTLLVCAGVAGALDETVRVGDVVVATTTVEHDFRSLVLRWTPPQFEGSGRHVAGLARAFAETPPPDFRLHTGAIASGDEAIVDAARREAVRARTGALAVAFEGAGGARATAFAETPYLEVRGITDLADSDYLEAFETSLPPAMAHVATAVAWLAEHPLPAEGAGLR